MSQILQYIEQRLMEYEEEEMANQGDDGEAYDDEFGELNDL